VTDLKKTYRCLKGGWLAKAGFGLDLHLASHTGRGAKRLREPYNLPEKFLRFGIRCFGHHLENVAAIRAIGRRVTQLADCETFIYRALGYVFGRVAVASKKRTSVTGHDRFLGSGRNLWEHRFVSGRDRKAR
jgi:hypothetical protein